MAKPIQTVYAGCRFRSRLEARWAIFFDHLSIRWQYEPQGYMVGEDGDQVPYLPDFYLPDLDLWAEVKGKLGDKDVGKLLRAAGRHGLPLKSKGNDGPKIILLGEIPQFHWDHSIGHHVIWYKPQSDRSFYKPDGPWQYDGNELWQGVSYFTDTGGIYYRFPPTLPLTDGTGNPLIDSPSYWRFDAFVSSSCETFEGFFYRDDTPFGSNLHAAYNIARHARFEHGETPRRPSSAKS